jgi:hypothetical protein
MYKFILIFFVVLLLNMCELNHGDTVCTEIFAAVTLRVEGKVLSDFYTLRPSTGELIRHESMFGDSIYTVLDDNYVSELKNSEDSFVFYGFYRGEKVIEENYVISADECHVQKITGASVMSL